MSRVPKIISISLKPEEDDQVLLLKKLKILCEQFEEQNDKLKASNEKCMEEIERLEGIIQNDNDNINKLENRNRVLNEKISVEKIDEESECNMVASPIKHRNNPSLTIDECDINMTAITGNNMNKTFDYTRSISEELLKEISNENKDLRNDVNRLSESEANAKKKYKQLKKQIELDYMKMKILVASNKGSYVGDISSMIFTILDKSKISSRIAEISKFILNEEYQQKVSCLLYTSPSPRDS